jgi:hypothetical protein
MKAKRVTEAPAQLAGLLTSRDIEQIRDHYLKHKMSPSQIADLLKHRGVSFDDVMDECRRLETHRRSQ